MWWRWGGVCPIRLRCLPESIRPVTIRLSLLVVAAPVLHGVRSWWKGPNVLRITSIAIVAVVTLAVAPACSSSSTVSPQGSDATSAVSSPSPTGSSNSEVALAPEVQEQLQKVIDDVRQQFNAPGLQAGVWTDSGQWVGTSGTAKVDTTEPITPADHTRIGSITKTMTGTVILQLIDEGALSFDDVIETFVPGMPNGATATIRDLLQMQSGIPAYTDGTTVVEQYAADPTTTFTPQELVDSVKEKPAMFEPGTKFFYSNTNYVLLGLVIEKVTGKSIADNFDERLFTPLGMSETSVPGDSTELPAPYLSGISTQADPEGTVKDATNWNPSLAFTAGEAISTLDDLHKWAVALGTGEGILPPETQQLRVDSVNTTVPPNTPERSYGMGIVNTGGWLGHTGEIPGYNTVVNYRADTKTAIVVMVNSDIVLQSGEAPAATAFEGLAAVMTPDSAATSAAAATPTG